MASVLSPFMQFDSTFASGARVGPLKRKGNPPSESWSSPSPRRRRLGSGDDEFVKLSPVPLSRKRKDFETFSETTLPAQKRRCQESYRRSALIASRKRKRPGDDVVVFPSQMSEFDDGHHEVDYICPHKRLRNEENLERALVLYCKGEKQNSTSTTVGMAYSPHHIPEALFRPRPHKTRIPRSIPEAQQAIGCEGFHASEEYPPFIKIEEISSSSENAASERGEKVHVGTHGVDQMDID